jgi:hypothetical protein
MRPKASSEAFGNSLGERLRHLPCCRAQLNALLSCPVKQALEIKANSASKPWAAAMIEAPANAKCRKRKRLKPNSAVSRQKAPSLSKHFQGANIT